MNVLSQWEEYGIDYDAECEAAINSLTGKDIQDLIDSIVKQNNFIEFKSTPAVK